MTEAERTGQVLDREIVERAAEIYRKFALRERTAAFFKSIVVGAVDAGGQLFRFRSDFTDLRQEFGSVDLAGAVLGGGVADALYGDRDAIRELAAPTTGSAPTPRTFRAASSLPPPIWGRWAMTTSQLNSTRLAKRWGSPQTASRPARSAPISSRTSSAPARRIGPDRPDQLQGRHLRRRRFDRAARRRRQPCPRIAGQPAWLEPVWRARRAGLFRPRRRSARAGRG